ncbi:hypothetical protein E2C01_033164 [Portunus trituberculatus]|uniref:Uncharacterized protein n=1 Tax=Portunus trituberculatus TaxID=210409 RepID=A0A5B7EX55_PORTR|nr:hypothetical protein [Portunus trituberculatus]
MWPLKIILEYLVGETYAAVHKHIDSDAAHLLSLLPITTAPFTTDTEYIVSKPFIAHSKCAKPFDCFSFSSP